MTHLRNALRQASHETKNNQKRRGKRPLRAESLESRVMCSANNGSALPYYSAANSLMAAAQISDDAPNTCTTSAPVLSLNSAGQGLRTGTLEAVGDHDVFKITIASSGRYQFDQIGTTLGDSYLRLLNSRGSALASDDNSGGGLNSRITYNLSAGTYYVEAGATFDSQAGAYNLSVSKLPPPNTPPKVSRAAKAASSSVTGVATTLSILGSDTGGEAALTYTWTAIASPAGASAPTFTNNGVNAAKSTTVTFAMAGSYRFAATITDAEGLSVTSYVNVTVKQSLTSVVVTPGTTSVTVGATQQFTATAIDQFGRNMASQPKFTWSTTAGKVSAGGLWTAPSQSGTATITAKTGSKAASAVATINPNANGIQDKELSALFTTLLVDGSISRNDMMQLLRLAGNDDGRVDAAELADLRNVLTNASTYQMAGYVQVLAGDVLNGNLANATFRGQSLGNLAAGSTAAQMNNLVDKWFLGADRPVTSYAYQSFSGSLFVGGPAYNDSNQGYLGDCYFIASMDAIAKSSPTAVQNMFIDNGDNTWTVRFYANGVADYVTVDRYLPTYYNYAIFADARGTYTNSGNELWMPLAEKAYAQWNETGKEGRDGKNSYASIEGGWMQTVCQQVLGKPSQTYWGLLDADKQSLIAAISANKAVTYATKSSPSNGLVGPHAYMVQSYNATTDTFQLYNPWGSSHPGALTYAQLRTNGQCFVIADTAGSVPALAAKAVGVRGAVATEVFAALGNPSSDAHCVTSLQEIAAVTGPVAPQVSTVATDRALADTLPEPASESARFLTASGPHAKTWASFHSAVERSFENFDSLDIDSGLTQFADLVHGAHETALATLVQV